MAVGPVQLIVLGFDRSRTFTARSSPSWRGSGRTILSRCIDALAVYKGVNGELEATHLSNLSRMRAIELGSKVGALVGLGFEGEEGLSTAPRWAARRRRRRYVFSDEDAWDVLADIPADSAAALLLMEHHWAVPLRDAIVHAGGYRIGDGFISPFDLVGIGLYERGGEELHAAETSHQPAVRPIQPPLRSEEQCSHPAESPDAPQDASPVAARRPARQSSRR